MKKEQNISVVIPTYNGTKLLKKFLPSVIAMMQDGDQLIIVDDASTDASIDWITSKFSLLKKEASKSADFVSNNYFPQTNTTAFTLYENNVKIDGSNIRVTLVALSDNLRFAGAANLGVIYAQNEYIYLLNNDVKPEIKSRSQLLKWFTDTTVFGVGCLEYEQDSTGATSGKNKLWFERGMFQHSKAEHMTTGETAWVSGGSGMFSKEKWLQLNGFDQLFYPAYWEDVDLSYRARKKGWKVLFEADAVVYHVHESTNNATFGSQKIMDMSWKNAQAFTKKHANILQLCVYYLFLPYWNYKRYKLFDKKIEI